MAALECNTTGVPVLDFLGRPARLVGMSSSFRRDPRVKHVEQNYVPPHGLPSGRAVFHDGYPLSLASEESLAEQNRRLGPAYAVPINRLRPNVVVRGLSGALAEDRWRTPILTRNPPFLSPGPSRPRPPSLVPSTQTP